MKRFSFIILLITLGMDSFSQHAVGDTLAQGAHAFVDHEAENTSHESNMAPLFFIIITLVIGAATRHFLKKTPLPYTVLLLLFGIMLGALARFQLFDIVYLQYLGHSVSWAGNIDPHVILFVFLPILIFEAAFAMDVHTFKHSFGNALILAVPGILLAMGLTAVIVMALHYWGIGFVGWEWQLAFMFGAVISATDPVAVVSLLKELGASKKLGTLIEGESLLNDGTAIVLFMVFFLALTGDGDVSNPFVEFVRVSVGGALVGFILAYITIQWVRQVFNDAMVEITVIIATAYLTFFLAEHFFHVSGVLALVTFGLMMAGVGKTRISPEVAHFLHEFWEFAAFIANTLIFVIVGVVIAQKTIFSSSDFLLLFLLYVGIHVVRAVVIGVHFPIMKNVGYGVSKKDSVVLWWGALRGAIGLALALVVDGVPSEFISAEIKNQFLFLTAGIVALTLLINATTIAWIVNKLGLTRMSLAKAVMLNNADKYLYNSSENAIERLKTDRFMGKANWVAVGELLTPVRELAVDADSLANDTLNESRRMILEKEKSSYWKQFQNGLLGPIAVRRLSETIDDMLDKGGAISLSNRADLEEMWKTSKMLSRIQKMPILGNVAKKVYFEQLTISYDSAKAFVAAQEESLKLLESMVRMSDADDKMSQENFDIIEEEINENRIQGLTFLRNLKKNLPEIYYAIATRQAMRSVLNHQRHTVERLHKNGRICSADAEKMRLQIEEKMKALMNTPIAISELETKEFLKEIAILRDLDHEQFMNAVEESETLVFSVGDNLIKEATRSDSIMIVTRGTVKVKYHDDIVAILGPGSIVGEIAMLTGFGHNATVVAESPVTVLKMNYQKVYQLMKLSSGMNDELWKIAGNRISKDMLKDISPFVAWDSKYFESWFKKGTFVLHPDGTEKISLKGKIGVLLAGTAHIDNLSRTQLIAPCLIDNVDIKLNKNAHLFVGELVSSSKV